MKLTDKIRSNLSYHVTIAIVITLLTGIAFFTYYNNRPQIPVFAMVIDPYIKIKTQNITVINDIVYPVVSHGENIIVHFSYENFLEYPVFVTRTMQCVETDGTELYYILDPVEKHFLLGKHYNVDAQNLEIPARIPVGIPCYINYLIEHKGEKPTIPVTTRTEPFIVIDKEQK